MIVLISFYFSQKTADDITLKFFKRKVQACGSVEQISDQSTLDDEEVPETISSSPTDQTNQSDQPVSRIGSTSTHHADEDEESSPVISRSTILRKSCMRSKRFLWTYESDRYYFFGVPILVLKFIPKPPYWS